MRNVLVGLVTTVVLASAIATNGCGGSSGGSGGSGGGSGGSSAKGGNASGGSGNGGSSTSGGSGGSSSQPSNCPAGSPCGGDVVGTWNVTSSCLKLSGDMDISLAGMGCTTIPVTGSLQVTGSWTAKANGSYTDNTITTGSMTFPLSSSCLTVSSVPVACASIAGDFTALGWKATCSTDNGECKCTATANQNGGIGVVSPYRSDSGAYTISGSGLNIDDYVDYSYCVSGKTLTMIPKPTLLPIQGTISLQNGSTSSTGGAGGASSSAGGAGGGSTGRGGAGGVSTGMGGAGGSSTGMGGTGGALSGSGGKSGAGGTTATGGSAGTGTGPCDIFGSASNKCVAAHSTVRALFGAYSGPLYQVKRKSDSTTKDIPVLSPGGFADSSVQDTFCTGTTCTITKVYDQAGNGNYVEAETKDAEDASVRPQAGSSGEKNMTAANAAKEPLTVGGHNVYSLWMSTSQAYWRDGSKSGMPIGKEPQGIYMVTSGKHFGSGCCFDYGNGETSRTYVPGPSMDAVNFSSCTIWGTGTGNGPWVMADLEGGLYAQGNGNKGAANNLSMTSTYVTAVEKNNGTGTFALKGADATTGKLTTFYSGAVPPGYNPSTKQGSIVLGSGGDCCYSNNTLSEGTFYEGAIVSGYPSDATDDAVQANVVSAGYGK